MQPKSEPHGTPQRFGALPDLRDLFGDQRWRLTPRQVNIHLSCRKLYRDFGRTAKIERWMWFLHWRADHLRALNIQMLAFECNRLTR